NAAAVRVYGYTHGELRALDVSELVVGAGILEQFPTLFERMGREGSILLESEHRAKDGTRIPVEVRSQRITLSGSDAVLSVARDITARKEEEHALRASERRERARADELEALMAAVPALVLVAHDPEARRITGNRAACELLRMPPESNLSQNAPEHERPGHYWLAAADGSWSPQDPPIQRAARGEEIWGTRNACALSMAKSAFSTAMPSRCATRKAVPVVRLRRRWT
ncbi:MAG: PAS domain S-box protein, partial [Halofilum sp. (in: g-proteobacteria)]